MLLHTFVLFPSVGYGSKFFPTLFSNWSLTFAPVWTYIFQNLHCLANVCELSGSKILLHVAEFIFTFKNVFLFFSVIVVLVVIDKCFSSYSAFFACPFQVSLFQNRPYWKAHRGPPPGGSQLAGRAFLKNKFLLSTCHCCSSCFPFSPCSRYSCCSSCS